MQHGQQLLDTTVCQGILKMVQNKQQPPAIIADMYPAEYVHFPTYGCRSK
jgi:hypothetical protein